MDKTEQKSNFAVNVKPQQSVSSISEFNDTPFKNIMSKKSVSEESSYSLS